MWSIFFEVISIPRLGVSGMVALHEYVQSLVGDLLTSPIVPDPSGEDKVLLCTKNREPVERVLSLQGLSSALFIINEEGVID